MANLDSTIQQIKDEIRVDADGKGTASMRGTARLAGVNEKSIRSTLKDAEQSPSKLAETLMELGYSPAGLSLWRTEGIPDIAVGEILAYYAYDAGRYCTEEAKLACKAFRAIGVRAWMQQVKGWEDPRTRRFTPEDITEICLLPSGRTWSKKFDDDYYDQLERLTHLKAEGYKRPRRWAQLTNEFVYDWMPKGVKDGLIECRSQGCGWEKLHQFLSDDGLEVFDRHMNTLLILMKAASTINDLRRMMLNVSKPSYQMQLFEDCRKDGLLRASRQMISN